MNKVETAKQIIFKAIKELKQLHLEDIEKYEVIELFSEALL